MFAELACSRLGAESLRIVWAWTGASLCLIARQSQRRNWSLAALTICCTSALAAQDARPHCTAVSGDTQWPTGYGYASGPRAVPDNIRLHGLLAGTFRILQVRTEAENTSSATAWTVSFAPIDTSLRAHQSGLTTPIMIGTRGPASRDSLMAREGSGRQGMYEASIERTTGRLAWYAALGTASEPITFDVSVIDSTGFSGRWRGGNDVRVLLLRSGYLVEETAGGYYCAVRVRD